MSHRAAWLAWSLCGLCVALAAGSLLLAALNGRTPGEILVDEIIITVAILTVAFCAAALTLFWTFLVEGIPDTSRLFEAVTAVLSLLVIPSIPIAAGIAIFKYRLYDIDVIINRTLVYGALTASLAVVYLGSVASLQTLFRTLTGGGSQLAVVASTLAIAALFNPLRRRVQILIDRRFYRSKYDGQKTLAAFGARLRDEVELDHLAHEFVTVVRQTVQPAHASLWLRRETATSHRTTPGEEEGR